MFESRVAIPPLRSNTRTSYAGCYGTRSTGPTGACALHLGLHLQSLKSGPTRADVMNMKPRQASLSSTVTISCLIRHLPLSIGEITVYHRQGPRPRAHQ